MADYPIFPLYVSDFVSGTKYLTPEQLGCYIRICLRLWDVDGYLPDDEATMASIAGVTRHRWTNHIKPILINYLTVEGGEVSQHRVLEELEKLDKKSKKCSTASKKRWAKVRKNNNTGDASAYANASNGKNGAEKVKINDLAGKNRKNFTKKTEKFPENSGLSDCNSSGEGMLFRSISNKKDKKRDFFVRFLLERNPTLQPLLAQVDLAIDGEAAKVIAPSNFIADKLNGWLKADVNDALRKIDPDITSISVEVSP